MSCIQIIRDCHLLLQGYRGCVHSQCQKHAYCSRRICDTAASKLARHNNDWFLFVTRDILSSQYGTWTAKETTLSLKKGYRSQDSALSLGADRQSMAFAARRTQVFLSDHSGERGTSGEVE